MQNSGCRPSTLYPTHHRPYSIYRNFSVVPRRVKGATVGFDLRLSLDSIPTGGGYDQRERVERGAAQPAIRSQEF